MDRELRLVRGAELMAIKLRAVEIVTCSGTRRRGGHLLEERETERSKLVMHQTQPWNSEHTQPRSSITPRARAEATAREETAARGAVLVMLINRNAL